MNSGLPKGAFNLPPGVTTRDVEGVMYCEQCGRELWSSIEEERGTCKHCAANEDFEPKPKIES